MDASVYIPSKFIKSYRNYLFSKITKTFCPLVDLLIYKKIDRLFFETEFMKQKSKTYLLFLFGVPNIVPENKELFFSEVPEWEKIQMYTM